jgi:hypothetical protein
MRALKITLAALVMAAMAAVAAAGDMTLTRAGDLYRLASSDDGLVVTGTLADGTSLELTVPQTAGTVTSALNLAVDPISDGLYMLWQEGEDSSSVVNFASYTNQTWTGPTVIAGGGSAAAANPQLLLFRAVDEVEVEGEDGEPVTEEVATTFLHMTWWTYTATVGDGAAVYLPAPVDDDTGLADLEAYSPSLLSDLLPYGIPDCGGIGDATGLAAPKLFSDPASGLPHLFASDFAECLFYVLRLDHDVTIDPITERRRHTIILRDAGTYPVYDALPLATAGVEVGHGLSFVLYWDAEDAVEYKQFDPSGSSDVMSLPLGDNLSHEQAVALIQSLAR